MKKGLVQFIGSDCHGAVSRPPDIGEAYRIINNKLGDVLFQGLFDFEDLGINTKRNEVQ